MSPKRKPKRSGARASGGNRHRDDSDAGRYAVRVRRVPQKHAWELVHPRCAKDRAEDIEEVLNMIEGGELEIARDELRWLLEGCSDFIAAHYLLGEIAVAQGDVTLARGHYGYAFRLGTAAIPRGGLDGPLAYSRPANRDFFSAGRALAQCLEQLGRAPMAREVLERLLILDPDDPLSLAGEVERLGR